MVLAKCQAFDRRTVGVADVEAWWEVLNDIDAQDALDAVIRHYRDRREWIMPSDVRRLAADIDRERRRADREAIESEEALAVRGPTTDRSREVRDAVRAILPKGDPDKLRWGHKHWRELQRDEERRRTAQANPDFAGYPVTDDGTEPSEVEGAAS